MRAGIEIPGWHQVTRAGGLKRDWLQPPTPLRVFPKSEADDMEQTKNRANEGRDGSVCPRDRSEKQNVLPSCLLTSSGMSSSGGIGTSCCEN